MKNKTVVLIMCIIAIPAIVFIGYQIMDTVNLKTELKKESNKFNNKTDEDIPNTVQLINEVDSNEVLVDNDKLNTLPIEEPVISNNNYNLTYHAELLKTNPVEALKLQSEERGHINAKWIPSFPPDDIEAQEYAKSVYHFIYNRYSVSQIQVEGLVNIMYESEQFKRNYGSTSARCSDLDKLSWVILTFPMSHYYGDYGDDMGKFNGWAQFASDYFPDHVSEMK